MSTKIELPKLLGQMVQIKESVEFDTCNTSHAESYDVILKIENPADLSLLKSKLDESPAVLIN
jgi:hypothetical protein